MLLGSLCLTLTSSVTAQVPETWAHPVDTVERSLKCLKAKTQIDPGQHRKCWLDVPRAFVQHGQSSTCLTVQGLHWF